MTVLVAQFLAALLKLAFGGLSLTIGRHVRTGVRGAAWTLTGIALLLSGASSVAHSGFAGWAVAAGAGSSVYETFLRWSPLGNHSRSLQAVAMGGLLLALLMRRTEPDRRWWTMAVGILLLAMAAGAALATAEGPFRPERHFPFVALYDMVELLILLGALMVGLARQTIDRFLWYCLGIYALRMALNVLWSSAFAWTNIPGMWRPSAISIQVVAVVGWAMMCGLALRRLRLAREGKDVSPPFEELGPARVSSFG